MKYYIVSNKHRFGDVIVFWKDNFSGYTKLRDSAGIYTLEEIREAKYDYPIFGAEKFNIYDEENFIISEVDLDIIAEQVFTYNYYLD